MKTENIFFYFLFILFALFALRTVISLYKDRNKVKSTQGTIIYYDYSLPEDMKLANAKLATFEYLIDGKTFVSSNTLKVPLSAEIGDVKTIKYYINNPNKLYEVSWVQFIILIIASVGSLLLALINY